MKSKFLRQKMLLLALFVTTAMYAHSQKTVTIISGKENNYCNGTCTLLNIPELNNNPDAIIMVTPIAKASPPMAAYYIKSKKDTVQWSILNLDNTVMRPGTQFSVQYYAQPDTTHFVHVVTQQNLQSNGSYIDHPGLNDNPNAQIKFFQNLAPILRGGIANNYDLQIQYDNTLGRWYMSNTNNQPLSYQTAYNISFSPGTVTQNSSNTGITSVSSNPITATSLTSNWHSIYIEVIGAQQGTFKVENPQKGRETYNKLTSFEMEMLRPTDPASGLSTGVKQYGPIIIEKEIGAASLQFLQAIANKESLTKVTIKVYSAGFQAGTEIQNYKIILTNARVTYFKQGYTNTNNELKDLIKLTFEKIEFDYSTPVIQVIDNWIAPNL